MTISKSLAVTGLAIAALSVANANPVVKLLTAGAKNGQTAQVTIWADPGKDSSNAPINLTGALLNFTVDTANTSVAATPVVTPGAAWQVSATNYSGGTVSIALVPANGSNGQNAPGTVATVAVTNTSGKSSTLTILPSSNVADDNFNQYDIPQSTASLLAGTVRQLGAQVSGSPSAGPGGVIAVVAGGKLNLLNGTDLTDVAGFTGVVLSSGLSPISRPAFGVVNGANVIAVATIDGKLALFNATSGAAIGTATQIAAGATNTSSPAIDNNTGDIYVAASTGSGATLARFVGGALGGAAAMNGASVTGSPAFVGGSVVAGTDTGLNRFTPSGSTVTPQSNVTSTRIDTAPVLRADGIGMVTSGGTIYQVNAITGSVLGTANADASVTKLSEGWYDSATGAWYYGANNGKVYGFTAGAGGPVSAAGSPTTSSTNAIQTQPLVINGTQYVVDVTGNFKRSTDTTGASIGGNPTPALAATGRGASDSVVVVEGNGGVALLPL